MPTVAPGTQQPPAPSGRPASSRSQSSAWFSAKIAPAPASQTPPKMDETLTTTSIRRAASVGAVGM